MLRTPHHASRPAIAALWLVAAAACTTTRTVPQAWSDDGSASAARSPVRAEVQALERVQRELLKQGVVEELHGLRVEDPFRALEQDSALTRRWIALQNARTRRGLAPFRDPARRARLRELLSIGSLGGPRLAAGRLLATRREGEREQAALYRFDREGQSPQLLIDPLDFGERAAIDWHHLSPGGTHVAFGISHAGDEESILHVARLGDEGAAELLDDHIPRAKWSFVSWLQDASGFYYTRYPAPGEPGHAPDEPSAYFPRLYFHALGADPKRDVQVFGSDTATDFPYGTLSEDDRYLLIVNHRGWTATDVWLLDRGRRPEQRVLAPDDDHPLRPIMVGRDAVTTGAVHDGHLLLVTNDGAPRRRVLTAPAESAHRPGALTELVPQGAGTIEDWALTRQHLALHHVEGMRSRLHLLDLDDPTEPREVALPAAGSIGALTGDPHGTEVAFVFSSFFHPPSLRVVDTGEAASRLVHRVRAEIDTADMVLSEQWVRSADGTPVHLFYVHRRELPRDGDNAVLVYGYGGFDVSLLPSFSRSALDFVQRGGVYAEVNLRGGGELGEAWHRAGMKEHKPRVFEDMEAALRFFSDSGISRPGRIAVTGGSNGGLLAGAMITRAPQLFGAAAAYVGLYDMVRYPRFPPAALWVSEYGDPSEPEALRYLHAYSPYHQIREGTRYPAALIETADHDTRVHWSHSAKFAARLSRAQAGEQPIYFHMTLEQGHGSGTRLSDLVDRYARQHAFLEQALGPIGR
ncbi:MAG: prolyl oligopeptidase family serine peptidase [Myxococcales bacterium]|jgi:prolyl oligopeptidase